MTFNVIARSNAVALNSPSAITRYSYAVSRSSRRASPRLRVRTSFRTTVASHGRSARLSFGRFDAVTSQVSCATSSAAESSWSSARASRRTQPISTISCSLVGSILTDQLPSREPFAETCGRLLSQHEHRGGETVEDLIVSNPLGRTVGVLVNATQTTVTTRSWRVARDWWSATSQCCALPEEAAVATTIGA
jgi:hypothetical protein